MANSVVKVSDIKDEELDDSLLLLVGEDGTVTPDQDTVESYLKQRNGPTNLQIMKFNRSEKQGIDITVDNVTFIPDAVNEEVVKCDMDEVARNLYNFRLDHDYTPLTSPKRPSTETEDDELARTLSILDGPNPGQFVDLSEPPPLIIPNAKSKLPPRVKLIQSITLTPPNFNNNNLTATTPVIADEVKSEEEEEDEDPEMPTLEAEACKEEVEPTPKPSVPLRAKTKPAKTPKGSRIKMNRARAKKEEYENQDDEEFADEDLLEEDGDDSDFNIEETKPKIKRVGRRTKNEAVKTPRTLKRKSKSKEEPKKEVVKEEVKIEEIKEPEKPETAEKKPVKKEKKPPKPIPDDFALFSTPDIIRRVGGKEPSTPDPFTPNKIQDLQRKSLDHPQSPNKYRKSVEERDSKTSKERRTSTSSTDSKSKRLSTDEKFRTKERRISDAKKLEKSKTQDDAATGVENLHEETKHFGIDHPLDSSSIGLDATGLDLDPALLDNLNNDEISEDILYQVAQSLVSNPELQNAIDKGINEGVLDPMAVDGVVSGHSVLQPVANEGVVQGATQIVRPDGRVVIIPPIERPTTRSRNKKTIEEVKPVVKPVHKPLDDDHVSGNELDSSNDEGEEESEDDPNKLWCICNQPHNNRFMICCDTCEEWYHGKCVNITKSMGQQMEAEGREWICLFCKDPSLKRPQAAARRIRKASRNSRTSTDSSGSAVKKPETSSHAIPCVVCQKPARTNSIYCSETCILTHAQGIERVVVFERSTGKMLTGNRAPSASNLDQWLKEHPGYEVVRSKGNVATTKAGNMAQTKLKLVKNSNNHGVSLAVQKKGGASVGVLKHTPKDINTQQIKSALKAQLLGQRPSPNKPQAPKESPKPKAVAAESAVKSSPVASTPPKIPKLVQSTLKTTITPKTAERVLKSPTGSKEKPVAVKERTLSTGSKEKIVIKTPKPKREKERDREETTPQKPQENIRENVQKTVFEQLMNRLKGVEDLQLAEDEVKSMSNEIESQLYKCFGDTGQKYRNKYRSLIFNIKDVKNQTLWRRICEKSINPYELVRLSTDDMANQELAQWREKEAKHQLDMIKKSELELLNCNRQYVLKTHKGEQVVEEEHHGVKVDNTEVIKSLTEGSALDSGEPKRDSSKERDKKGSSKHGHRDRDRKTGKDKEHRSHRSSSRDRDKDRSRRRSKSRDRKHGDRKKRSRSRERDRSRHRKSSHKSSRHRRDIISSTDKLDKKSKEILEQLVDNKIVPPLEDRLWKHVPQDDIVPAAESDSDHEPSSTVTIPTPPRVPENEEEKNLPPSPDKEKDPIEFLESTSPPPVTKPTETWRGIINMNDVAEISITAHEVSGDCSGLNKELSPNLDIVGRISPEIVWDYIGKMKCSNSRGISLIRLNATNVEEKMPYLALYSYLSSRDRLGVVKSSNKAVKDFYIYPLAPQRPIPQALLPLNGPGFEESRPALLLGIIVRDRRKRPHLDLSVPVISKKTRIETPPLPAAPPPTAPAPPPPPPRSYTPPPIKDPRLHKATPSVPALKGVTPILPSTSGVVTPTLPPGLDVMREATPPGASEGDEPYSPGDSPDPSPVLEVPPVPVVPAPAVPTIDLEIPAPSASFPVIPGLGTSLPSSTLEVQRQIEELNKKIEMQKSEITSMTQNIVSASSEIGTSALANIALPTNLQQILDSIKSIGDTTDTPDNPSTDLPQTDLTIPLMIPKRTSRSLPKSVLPGDTIPLKLPTKPLIKPRSVSSPIIDERPSVLSSLSEEELIKKAAEMLGEVEQAEVKDKGDGRSGAPQSVAKRAKIDVSLPPVPGLEDDE